MCSWAHGEVLVRIECLLRNKIELGCSQFRRWPLHVHCIRYSTWFHSWITTHWNLRIIEESRRPNEKMKNRYIDYVELWWNAHFQFVALTQWRSLMRFWPWITTTKFMFTTNANTHFYAEPTTKQLFHGQIDAIVCLTWDRCCASVLSVVLLHLESYPLNAFYPVALFDGSCEHTLWISLNQNHLKMRGTAQPIISNNAQRPKFHVDLTSGASLSEWRMDLWNDEKHHECN